MASYLTVVNQLIAAATARIPNAVLYGENINTGSHLCGMTRNLTVPPGGRIINVGNCEPTHCGVGFGLMLNGVAAVLFMKQLDFTLLGLDHLVSTYNVIRAHRAGESLGSFTICVIVCDQGFQGPQSSANALGDVCSLARVPGYTLTNAHDAAHVLNRQLTTPGFRLIALSQRLFPTECLPLEVVSAADDASLFQYTEGRDVTIACFNFSLPEGYRLHQKLLGCGLTSSLFSVNHVLPHRWERITQSVAQTQRVVVMDDSKSVNLLGYTLLHEVAAEIPTAQRLMVARGADVDFGVCADRLSIDDEALIAQLTGSDRANALSDA